MNRLLSRIKSLLGEIHLDDVVKEVFQYIQLLKGNQLNMQLHW